MLGLIPKLPLYWSYRHFGWPMMLPFSIVVSISYRCNSKCKTCDVWRRPNDDMTLEEWRKVFHKLGKTPFYITFTGGDFRVMQSDDITVQHDWMVVDEADALLRIRNAAHITVQNYRRRAQTKHIV